MGITVLGKKNSFTSVSKYYGYQVYNGFHNCIRYWRIRKKSSMNITVVLFAYYVSMS